VGGLYNIEKVKRVHGKEEKVQRERVGYKYPFSGCLMGCGIYICAGSAQGDREGM